MGVGIGAAAARLRHAAAASTIRVQTEVMEDFMKIRTFTLKGLTPIPASEGIYPDDQPTPNGVMVDYLVQFHTSPKRPLAPAMTVHVFLPTASESAETVASLRAMGRTALVQVLREMAEFLEDQLDATGQDI